MGDPTLFRGRLNGASVADPNDVTSPAGEEGAVVTVIREDSDASGAGIHVQALVFLPNGLPCPLYAANLHLFGRCDGPPSVPLALEAQPRVIVRRDMSAADGSTCCWNIIISPTFVVRGDYLWDSATYEPTYQSDNISLTFYGPTGTQVAGKLGYHPLDASTASSDVIQPGSPVLVTARTNVGPTFPSGYDRAWVCAPLSSQMVPCVVTGGTGTAMVCDLYARDLITPTETGVNVTQLLVVGDVPAGAWTFATRINGVWYAQVPVWVV